MVCDCRHLIGFLFFLALTIYTIRAVPKETVVLPERLSSMVHMPNRADLHQLHVELVTCFPALANVPSFLQEHLPHILAKCIPDTPTIAANSTQQCFMVTSSLINIPAGLMLSENQWMECHSLQDSLSEKQWMMVGCVCSKR